MDKRESWVFYRSFYDAGKCLTEEQRGKYYTLIFEYMFDFSRWESDDPIVNAMFLLIAPQVEANIKKYFNWKEPKTQQDTSKSEAKDKQDGSKAQGNVDVYDDVYDDGDDKKKKAPTVQWKIIPPSLEHVKEYCDERKNTIDPQTFLDHYETNGRVQGRGNKKVKDWKACVRTRENNQRAEQKAKEPQTMDEWVKVYEKMWHVPFRIKYWTEKATEIKLYII